MDLFNDLFRSFEARICLTNCTDKTFDYRKIYEQLDFSPILMEHRDERGQRKRMGYWKQLDEFKPDLVIVGEFGFEAIKVLLHRFWKRRSYKVITICDDSYDMIANRNDFSFRHRVARKVIAPWMDEIIVVEPKVAKWYQRFCGKGVCFPIIRSDKRFRSLLEQTLPNSREMMRSHALEHKNVFGFVGRFVALKNIGLLIRAFAQMNQSENVLVLIGSGEEETNLRELAHETGANVIFIGRLEGADLYAWYNVIDYFVLCSYLEPFGAVTNEALLAGCYSLISNRAGSRCLIEVGRNGAIIDPQDVSKLHEKMEWIVNTFPPKRPLNKVKDNLMVWDYDAEVLSLLKCLTALSPRPSQSAKFAKLRQ